MNVQKNSQRDGGVSRGFAASRDVSWLLLEFRDRSVATATTIAIVIYSERMFHVKHWGDGRSA